MLTAVKGAALGALLSLSLVGGLQATSSTSGSTTGSASDAYERVVERAVPDHRCSWPGLGRPAPAGSAVIRTSGGDLRVVSFEKGWDVYNGRRPGSLLSLIHI